MRRPPLLAQQWRPAVDARFDPESAGGRFSIEFTAPAGPLQSLPVVAPGRDEDRDARCGVLFSGFTRVDIRRPRIVARAWLCSLAAVLAISGCPQPTAPPPVRAINPVIGTSATRGPAPLSVAVSASESTSEKGIVRILWDFGDGATADRVDATHVYALPGRYEITLTLVDTDDVSASARTEIRVEGGPVRVIIRANPTSGVAPLAVQFDGTTSTAQDDTIRDYFWSFGDAQIARTGTPLHIYERPGLFTVRLRVVSGGGVEAVATGTIEVRDPNAP